MTLLLNIASTSHPGKVRLSNEDAIFTWQRPNPLGQPLALLIVADGMGGHQAGEVASQLAVDTVHRALTKLLDESPSAPPKKIEELENLLRAAIHQANNVINKYSKDHPDDAGNLGSTTTCALIYGAHLVLANVGDSRAYLWRGNELKQLTEDHSYVAQLVREGQLEPDAVYSHPHRSVIMRALGHELEVEVDIWTHALEAGDRVLLCSDGLWELVRDPQIAQRLTSSTQPETAVRALINDANQEGGVDNVSVIVADLVENESQALED